MNNLVDFPGRASLTGVLFYIITLNFYSSLVHADPIEEVVVTGVQYGSGGSLGEMQLFLQGLKPFGGDTGQLDIDYMDAKADGWEDKCFSDAKIDGLNCQANAIGVSLGELEDCGHLLLIPEAEVELEVGRFIIGGSITIKGPSGAELRDSCQVITDRQLDFDLKICDVDRAEDEHYCTFNNPYD